MRRLLSVLVAALMLFTMPITTGIARAVAEGTTEQTETPSEGIALETEEMDPNDLHVPKLGEVEEEEEPGEFDPDDIGIVEDLNRIVRASIFLDGKSTIDKGYDMQGIAENSSATAYRNKLKKQQETMQQKIEDEIGHPLTVKWNLTLLVNAISVEIPYKDIVIIQRMDGVKSVELENIYAAPEPVDGDQPMTASTSAYMVGAQAAWADGYTGAGSRIAILDTGVDDTHELFNASEFNYAITQTGKTVDLLDQAEINSKLSQLNAKQRMTSVTAAQLYNSNTKVPFRFNYADGNVNADHMSGYASNHGSHVAGIAAGNRFVTSGSAHQDSASTVGAVGMAPDAQILAMKVFGSSGGAADSDYFAALEDAIILDCDAVNLSLGSSVHGWTYTNSYQDKMNDLVNNSTDNHLVVAIAAGNAGAFDDELNTGLYAEDAYFNTVGSPGSFINSLAVAAAQNTKLQGAPLTFNGSSQRVFYYESTEGSDGTAYSNPKMTTVAGTWDYVYIDAIGEATDYSTVNSALSLSGKIVIVNRGEINFTDKGNNLKSYNPKALIVANTEDELFGMDLKNFTGSFPFVSITSSNAAAIKAGGTAHTAGDITYYTGSVTVTATEVTDHTDRADARMASFSSWGVPGSLILKPEIVAPGGSINSVKGATSSDSTQGYAVFNGTSMATPHIAGLAAILAEYLRENDLSDTTADLYNTDLTNDLNPRAIIQSLLMSTATPMKNDSKYVSLLQQGAGLAEVSKAVEAKSVIKMNDAYLTASTGANEDGKVKVELGDDPARAGAYEYSFTVYNLSGEMLEYTLDTKLFTQAINGEYLSHGTVDLPTGGVTYDWVSDFTPEGHDVDMDGDTDDADAQAILDYLTGEKTAAQVDLTVADLDEDGAITSHDAHVLLNWQAEAAPAGYVISAHGKATVTVHINLTAAQKAVLNRDNGAYLEGFTYVTCTTSTGEGLSLAHEHTIPIFGYFGSWTDPTMFDTTSYVENLYGSTQESYSFNSASATNYLRITQNGTTVKFSGNPYKPESTFPADRLAVNSSATFVDVCYNLIRGAAGTGYAISKLNSDGTVNTVLAKTVTATNVYGQYYYESGETWENTTSKLYALNKTLSDYSVNDGDRVRVGFYAIPEYNAMKLSADQTAADAGTLTAEQFETLLTTNVLGKGAFVGYDFTIDNAPPQIVDTPTLNGNTLSITASDNHAIAYIAVLSLDGSVIYAEATPGTDTYTVSFDATEAIANAQGYVAAFVGDYAGNEAAFAVQVNNNNHVEKTVYVLTSTVTAGEEYLIMNTNAAGNGYSLYYTMSGTNANPGAIATPIQAGTSGTNNQPYVESADVAATAVWKATAGQQSSYVRFCSSNNNNLFIRRGNSSGNNYAIAISTGTNRRDFIWTGPSTLKYASTNHYMRYNNGTFDLTSSSSNKVYMYVKTTISSEVDPYAVSSVTVTPNTLDLYKGNTAALTAKVIPLTATDRTVNWTSSNTSVATVDQNGIVTAVGSGTATIRATSNADSSKYGECSVTVSVINKALNAIVWDEDADIYFSSFNANGLPTWTKLHNSSQTQPLINAYMADSSTLYASTCDVSGDSVIYTVNRSTYALTEYGTNMIAPFGMARASSYYTGYFVYGYANYLIFGNLAPEEDEDGNMLSGQVYGLLNLTTTDVGEAYVCAVCVRNIGTTSSGFYFLDETGKIWQTTLTIGSSVSFGTPTIVYDTGIGTSMMYQSLYFDGTDLYWSHCDGEKSELIILANANNSTNRKLYHAGNFGADVWPVTGLYVNGSAAPASVEPGDEIMGEGEPIEGLQIQATRDELMTEDVMARFAAEAEKFSRNDASAKATDEPIELPEMPNEEPVEEPEEPEDGEHRAHILHTVVGTATNGTVPFSESEASTNGAFTVSYDTSKLTCTNAAAGNATNLFVSVHHDATTGQIKVAYAMKGTDPLAANTTIATATFTSQACGEESLTVATTERNTSYNLTESGTVAIEGLGHNWGTPTWTWTGSDADGWTAATATFVCTRDSSHIQTVDATVTSEENASLQMVYTATATFESETYTDVKTVGITAYYLIGSMTNWQVDPAYRFTPNGSTEGEFILSTNLAVNDQIKVVQATGTTTGTWYPADYGNYYVDYAHSGSVNVYFRPASNGDWWSFHSGGYFYISKLHTVTVVTDGNGTATLVPEQPDITATVYVTPTPNDGYHYDHTELYKRTGAGENDLELVTLDWNETNKTFTMPDFDVVIKVYFAAHTYGAASYEWSADNGSVTATHTCTACGHVETETVSTTSEVTTPATCETDGVTTYIATFTKAGFETQTKNVTNVPAIGHAYGAPTYEWAADNSSVTATRVCANDASHVETETVSTTYAVTTAATCEAAGVGTYTATFTNSAFATQTKTEEISATGHAWTFVDFTWTGDDTNGYTAAAANYVCGNDSTHTQTVNATLTSETTPGTCLNPGETTYTATVAAGSSLDGAEHTDTKTVTIASSGHDWGAPTYEWAADNSTVTATRVCANDASHVETETANTSYAVTTAATCEAAGVGTYTATFTNSAFETQTKEVEIAATGHAYGEPTYEWAADNSTVTATRVCANDTSHVETETANTSYAVTTAATCEAAGVGTYTATFTNAAFAQQTKEVEIAATGHAWTFVDFTWTETSDGWTAVANYVCDNDSTHTKTETATVTSETTPATCEADGSIVYTATEGGQTDTKTVTLPATGHAWTLVDFTWTETSDGYTAVANLKCTNDETHTQTVNATVTSETTDATCETAGSKVYTATATYEGETYTDTKTVEIPAIGHAYGTPTYVWAEDNSTVTATRVCANDASHVETETVNTTYEVTTAPTFNTEGEGVYTATFTNPAFEEQTKTVVIPKLTETCTVVYMDVRHGVTLQVFTVEINADEPTPTPAFTAFDAIGTYDDCRYDSDDMWTTAVAENVTGDAIYVLKWINVYTVTFLDAEGGVAKTVSVDQNGTIPANEVPAPEKVGYTLTGWTEDSVAFDLAQPIKRNITLTPVYTINTYTVTFDPNNGGETFTASVEHGGAIAAPEQPTNGGKVFEGWFADGAAEAFDFDTPITGNMTLTAHWSEQLEMIGTRISFEDGAVLYNNGTPYVIWNGEMTPAIRVEAENDDVLTSSDYTITYLRNAEPGTGYIRVTVTKTGYNSPADAWFKIYLPASESLTVENIKAGIKLTWTPVEGAAGYVIYRRAWSTTTNGWTAFDRWYNTTETTWTDGSDASHKVYAGTRYQYGIKAYFAEKTDDVSGATIGGAMDNYNLGVVSSLKTTVRITTRTLNSVISSDGKLAVKWSGSKVFTGYQVQIATDENFTTIVKDEKIASATTYSKVYEGLTVGTTYYVRIRSYHVFNGMTYYGEWSNVKNAMLQ